MSTLEDRISARQRLVSNANEPRFVVGQNSRGAWVALETHGRAGGVFISRDAALHYAEFETGYRQDAVLLASQPVELKL